MRRVKQDPNSRKVGNGPKRTSIGNSKRSRPKNKHKRRQKGGTRGQKR